MYASVIGQRCTIGPGAVLRDAYIFDDTTVGAGCVVEGSIVGTRVSLGDNARVPRGCLIADGVVIGAGAKLRNFERVSKRRAAAAAAAAATPSQTADDDGSDGDDEDDDSDLEDAEASACDVAFSSILAVARRVAHGGYVPALQMRKTSRLSLAQVRTLSFGHTGHLTTKTRSTSGNPTTISGSCE